MDCFNFGGKVRDVSFNNQVSSLFSYLNGLTTRPHWYKIQILKDVRKTPFYLYSFYLYRVINTQNT